MSFTLNRKCVAYSEVPPQGAAGYGYRVFDVTIGNDCFQLAANERGEVAKTADHPIVCQHPDVVREIIAREFQHE